MKQFALAFLTVLMLMPSLACAMPMCKSDAQASGTPPCHGATHANQENADQKTGGMLIQDCLDVDFMAQNISYDIQPDLSLDSMDFAWADLSILHSFELQNINSIRGPPIIPDQARTGQHTYLTTKRLRI